MAFELIPDGNKEQKGVEQIKKEQARKKAIKIIKERGYKNIDEDTIRISSKENLKGEKSAGCIRCDNSLIAFDVMDGDTPKERRFCCSDVNCTYDRSMFKYGD